MGVMSALPTLKKRDLAGLREEIADLEVGDQVRVHLRDKSRYGDFVVAGEVYRTPAGELCMCGFTLVDAKGKPSAMLTGFDPDVADPSGRMSGALAHGQVARITVVPAGIDRGGTITGLALKGQSDSLTVVAGFIVDGIRCSGALATDEHVEGVPLRTPMTEAD